MLAHHTAALACSIRGSSSRIVRDSLCTIGIQDVDEWPMRRRGLFATLQLPADRSFQQSDEDIMRHSLLRRLLCLLITFTALLTGCGSVPSQPQVAQHASSTPTTTATPRRPTATTRPATPTPGPPTATALPPTGEPALPPSTALPPANIPVGWLYHDVSQLAGLGFALPPSWDVVRLDQDGIDALAEAAPVLPQGKQSPEDLAASGMKIVACDCRMPTNKPGVSTLFIMTDELPSAMSLDEVVTTLVGGIEQSPLVIGPVKHTRIPHPTGPTEAIQYRMRSSDMQLTFTHYVMVQDRHFVFVGILASVDRAEQDTPTYYKIIQTFRFTAAISAPM